MEFGLVLFRSPGIPGSGKTEVFLHAVEHCLRQGKRVLVLVP
jgi:primosomal protein N' (replication factor Y)